MFIPGTHICPDEIIDLVHSPIGEEVNASLCVEFTDEGIGDAHRASKGT
jgi:hypothetical protein